MTEEFIHYLWRFQLIRRPLVTSQNENIEIFSTGQRNRDSGPDYLNARIRIGDTLWAGDVEIHVKSSDWYLHGHSTDRAYDGVILHLVDKNDGEIERFDGQEIPMLVIENLYDKDLYFKYESFLTALGWIPCEGLIYEINPEVWESWLVFLAEERLGRKSQFIDRLFVANKGHVELTFYQCLASGFGQKVNTSPFESLAQSIDIKLVMKYQQNLLSLEALFFGQAGFLEDTVDDKYYMNLKEEYLFLKNKYELDSLPVHIWKFLRMRPAGFPTVKIAQWAGFLHYNADKLVSILEMETAEEMMLFFERETSEYWWNHFHFNRKTTSIPKKLGEGTALAILLNSVIPFIFVRGLRTGDKSIMMKAIDLLKQLPSEENSIIRQWKSLGVISKTALDSQALIELKNQYCDHKNCLHCAIGNELLKNHQYH